MEKKRKERILYFDLIKLIATICVFCCHFTRSMEAQGIGFDFKVMPDNVFGVYLGSYGVSLFFIVSGAALMYVYDDTVDWKNYYVKRFKGIYPLFWLTWTAAFLVNFYNQGGLNHGIPKWSILFSILGCDGNAQWFMATFYLVGEWFLSVIVMLYVVFPLLRWCMRRQPWITMLLSIVLLLALNHAWDSVMPLDCLFLARIPEFAFGMFFIKVIKRPRAWMGLGGIFLIAAALWEEPLLRLDALLRTELVGVVSFLFFAFLLQVFKGILTERLSVFVNRYMYGFFLTHHFVQLLVLQRFRGGYLAASDVLVAFVLCLTVTILAMLLLNRLNQKLLNGIDGCLADRKNR